MPTTQEIQERAHSNGISFLQAAQQLLVPKYTSPNNFTMPAGPAIVCYAFSLELLLKSVLLREGKSLRGHDLLELFNNLSEESQAFILREAFSNLKLNKYNFNVELDKIKNLFNEFRYIHERDYATANLRFMHWFSETISTL